MAHLPVDHPLRGLYRGAALLTGAGLTVFGVVGYARSASLPFFDQDGVRVFMLSTNRAFALLSIVVGLLVLVVTAIGRNLDVPANVALGGVFLLSGLVMLCVLRTGLNFLAFSVTNVNVSFVIGLILITAGLYGTVSRQRRAVDASEVVEAEKASTH
jgi:uncharacterized membrane protein YoaK (UPF0700 family)